MRKTRPIRQTPPGLVIQIVFAAIITLAAVVLPTALTAKGETDIKLSGVKPLSSAGTIVTTTRAFSTADYGASAFGDWDHQPLHR